MVCFLHRYGQKETSKTVGRLVSSVTQFSVVCEIVKLEHSAGGEWWRHNKNMLTGLEPAQTANRTLRSQAKSRGLGAAGAVDETAEVRRSQSTRNRSAGEPDNDFTILTLCVNNYI
eukprot:g10149.t1